MTQTPANVALDGERPKFTKTQVENAMKDADAIIRDSPAVRAMCVLMRSSRQLYLIARDRLDIDLKYKWNVQNRDLVTQVFVGAEERQAVDKPWTAETLLECLRTQIVPILELIVSNEKEANRGQALQRGQAVPAPEHPTEPGPDVAHDAGGACCEPGRPCEGQKEPGGAGGEADGAGGDASSVL